METLLMHKLSFLRVANSLDGRIALLHAELWLKIPAREPSLLEDICMDASEGSGKLDSSYNKLV